MSEPLEVRVGSLLFSGGTYSGFLLSPDGFAGWEGAPGSRRNDIPRPNAHGSFRSSVYRSGRLITLSGACLATDSERELLEYGDRLGSLCDGDHQISVKQSGTFRWSMVTVEGEIKFDRIGGSLEAAYQVSLFAADPRKYGDEREFVSTGGGVYAYHYGNADAWPTFEVTGFPNGYRIEGLGPNDGRFYTVSEKPGSATDLIDFKSGMITRNGVPVSRVTTQRHVWPVVPNGETPWRVRPLESGSGSALMRVLDTWM